VVAQKAEETGEEEDGVALLAVAELEEEVEERAKVEQGRRETVCVQMSCRCVR
jgi:hypothetical protein